jgi:hypothetical protein
MTVEAWLSSAIADASQRGLPQLKPLLESLAAATRVLRGADVFDSPDGPAQSGPTDPPRR